MAYPLLFTFLAGCVSEWTKGESVPIDQDGDWLAGADDCDETDSTVNINASETWYDGIDANCDGLCDFDLDGDKFADASHWDQYQSFLSTLEGTDKINLCESVSTTSQDCDDTTDSVNPGQTEVNGDGIDNDCDGTIDIEDVSSYYVDADGDGYGDPATGASYTPEEAESLGLVTDGTDCDDANPEVHPGATEVCDGIDNDCNVLVDDEDDTVVGQSIWYQDTDGDAYGASGTETVACDDPHSGSGVLVGGDCNDEDASYYPGAPTDICDGEDRNCDTISDSLDEDLDGFAGCEGDCDDTEGAVNPDALEVCDDLDIDENCSGAADDDDPDVLASTLNGPFYTDADGDGQGAGTAAYACDADTTWVEDDLDCDDTDPTVYTGATETCNDVDDDCDGEIDDGAVDATTWYADEDLDGYGNPAVTTNACEAPVDYVDNGEDCDDTDAAVSPDTEWHADDDGDGYGDASAVTLSCLQPTDHVSDATDCDDTDVSAYPGATETAYDTIDQDCDGSDLSDVDEDGYNSTAVTGGTDCDDTRPAVYPGAPEYCSTTYDDDCDGTANEAASVDASLWYLDSDLDGYGVATSTTSACTEPAGYTDNDEDCDDTLATVSPAETEVCEDGLDNDCDGSPSPCDYSGTVGLSSYTQITGDTASQRFGFSASGAGDINGDGLSDFVVGARSDPSGGTDAGAAYVFYGSIGGSGLAGALSVAKLIGEDATDYAGWSVSSGSQFDFNGDGVSDILVGAYGEDTGASDAGAAYVVLGPVSGNLDLSAADAKLYGQDTDDWAGASVAALGDLDGDGDSEVAIGAFLSDNGSGTDAGDVYIVGGPFTGSLDLAGADGIIHGDNASDGAGVSVAAAGDMDGDGLDDLLIGAYQNDSRGAVYLLQGPVTGSSDLSVYDAKVTGKAAGDQFGISVAQAGDMNGDGYPDLITGARYSDEGGASNAGAFDVFYGPLSGLISGSSADATGYGTTADDYVGFSVAGAGDVNSDGFSDIVVGSYQNDTAGSNAGMSCLNYGPLAGSFAFSSSDACFTGEGASNFAGYANAGVGDTDGDGYDDVLVGAYRNSDGGSQAGAAYLLLGSGW